MSSSLTTNDTPMVSVLMPVYNCEKHLRTAIESVLNQSFGDFELIVADDGSTDASRDIVFSYNDIRIVYIGNPSNLGIVSTLNRGIQACRGKYIARMDGDDVCSPLRLERQVSFMERHPDTGLCGTWTQLIDDVDRKTSKGKNLTRNDELRINLLFSVPFYHPSVMIRADLLKENPYDPNFPQAQDYELWTRLADKTKIANLPEYLLDYRWHPDNTSVAAGPAQNLKKREVLRREINKLGIDPTDEQLDLHQAAFRKWDGDEPRVNPAPKEVEDWYKILIGANLQAMRYPRDMFRAYLWARYVVYCKMTGNFSRTFNSSLVSGNPAIFVHFSRFMGHFAGK